MRDATADAPAAKADGSIHPATMSRLKYRNDGDTRIFDPACGIYVSHELTGHVREKETGNAIFVSAFLLIQHPGVITAHDGYLLFRFRSRNEKPSGGLGQIRTIGRLDE